MINLAAIKLGYGGVKIGSEYSRGPHREVGLYFDAGTLGNMAFFNFTFTVFGFAAARSRKTLWLLVAIASALVDLYLIAISGSRAPLVMLAVAAMGYLWYLRGWARIAAPILGTLLLLAAGTLFLDDSSPVLERLEGDVAALESDDPGIGQSMSGRVSLGKYESLGNNRGRLWADALTELFRQPTADIVFGSYFSKIRAHSDYIDIMARNGIVGLGLYVFLIYGLGLKTLTLARGATRPDHRLLQILACVLLACYAFNCFPFRPLVYTTTNWYMWTIVALALAAVRQGTRKPVPTVATHSGGAPPSGKRPRADPVAGHDRKPQHHSARLAGVFRA
jgi:O-antigen ligase